MTERVSEPQQLRLGEESVDPDLLALPAPPRRSRALALGLLAATGLFAAVLALGLASDVQYAFAGVQPTEVGNLAELRAREVQNNRFVTAAAKLDMSRVLRYGRTTESDMFELAPILGNDHWWVEMRVPPPADASGIPTVVPTREPPQTFVGRLVPMQSAVFRYRGLGRSSEARPTPISPEAWVLIDGATPTSYRWTVALALLLLLFAGYSLTTIVRLARPMRR